ncbi:hypothetical protein L195_g037406 [Trifolium pratense]|uniref:Uncharacterized protein n=2 Tax=Trifolium pratense TaxID=57577 RepID=A0A2K3LS71_TRIPR|nr:hypothetical protein L195_g037406 [Trifolium pratense]
MQETTQNAGNYTLYMQNAGNYIANAGNCIANQTSTIQLLDNCRKLHIMQETTQSAGNYTLYMQNAGNYTANAGNCRSIRETAEIRQILIYCCRYITCWLEVPWNIQTHGFKICKSKNKMNAYNPIKPIPQRTAKYITIFAIGGYN